MKRLKQTNNALWDMIHCMSLLRAKHPECFEVLNINKRIEEATIIARQNNVEEAQNNENNLSD